MWAAPASSRNHATSRPQAAAARHSLALRHPAIPSAELTKATVDVAFARVAMKY